MSEKLQVKEPATLLTFLGTQLQGWARSKIKQRLQSGCVCNTRWLFYVINSRVVLKR